MDGGASPQDPPCVVRIHLGNSPVGICSGVKYLLEEWAPTQHWGRVGTLEAVELALCKIGNTLGELSGHGVA